MSNICSGIQGVTHFILIRERIKIKDKGTSFILLHLPPDLHALDGRKIHWMFLKSRVHIALFQRADPTNGILQRQNVGHSLFLRTEKLKQQKREQQLKGQHLGDGRNGV